MRQRSVSKNGKVCSSFLEAKEKYGELYLGEMFN